jgi:hypothetical protein
MREEPDAEDVQLGERQHRIARRRVVDDSGNVDGEVRGVRADLLVHEACARDDRVDPNRESFPVPHDGAGLDSNELEIRRW